MYRGQISVEGGRGNDFIHNAQPMASAAWYRINNTLDASAPSRRECHSIVVSGHRLFLFGGNDDAGRFREVHILDTGAWRGMVWRGVA